MKPEHVRVIEECGALSLEGRISFPEVVRRLGEIGVERYHADLSRGEKTYYTPAGESHAHGMGRLPEPIGGGFSPAGVDAAVRASQAGQIDYAEFLRRIMRAGCVGYFVCLSGRRAVYFGREGDTHVEPFPGAARSR